MPATPTSPCTPISPPRHLPHSGWRAWVLSLWHRALPPYAAAALLALWMATFLNQAWWHKLTALSPEQPLSTLQYAVTAVVLAAACTLWLWLLSWPRLRRLGWSVTLLTAAAVQYFMLHYGIVMDTSMVRNAMATNPSEGLALLTPGLAGHVLLWAGLPVLWLWRGVRWQHVRGWAAWWHRSAAGLVCVTLLVSGGLWLYKPMAPLVRNHTEIRYLLNPLATVVATLQVTLQPLLHPPRPWVDLTAGSKLGTSYAVPMPLSLATASPPRSLTPSRAAPLPHRWHPH